MVYLKIMIIVIIFVRKVGSCWNVYDKMDVSIYSFEKVININLSFWLFCLFVIWWEDIEKKVLFYISILGKIFVFGIMKNLYFLVKCVNI